MGASARPVKHFRCLNAAAQCASARSASSGVLTLKNGSTGSAGQSAMATPCRAVQTSILRRPSSTSALRRSVAQRQRPQAHHGVTPFAGAGAGERHAGALLAAGLVQALDQVVGQKRAVARHAEQPFDAVVLRGQPVEPGEDAGERPRIVRHVVGHDRAAGVGKARRVAIGVDDDVDALRPTGAPARGRGW